MIDKKGIASLDIETSGLNAKDKKFFTWSVGVSKFDDTAKDGVSFTEDFYRPIGIDKKESQRIMELHKFGQDQAKAGVFNSYFQNFGTFKDQKSILKDLTAKLQGTDILLMQNANFERRAIEGLMEISSAADVKAFGDLFETRYADTGLPYLGPSPDILEKKNIASGKFSEYLADPKKNEKLFGEAAAVYDDIMDSYLDQIHNRSGRIKVVDQLDFTKGLYMKAANMGLLDKQYASVGTAQSFLSEFFLKEAESHTSGSDSSQTARTAFNHILTLYEDLKTGNPSDETLKTLQKIRAVQPIEAANQLQRGLVRAVNEASEPTGYKLYDTYGKNAPYTQEFINSSGQTTKITRMFKTSGHATNDPNLAIADTMKRYENIETKHVDKTILAEELLKEEDVPKKKEILERVAEDIKNSKTAAKGLNNRAKLAMGLGGIALLATMALDNSKEDIDKVKNKKKMKDQFGQSVESNLKLYSNQKPRIQTYHGSGFADWNERTKHHEY